MLPAIEVTKNEDLVSSYTCCYTTEEGRYASELANLNLDYNNAFQY